MASQDAKKRRRQFAVALATVGIASGALAWQFAPRSWAQEVVVDWSGGGPIGEFYSHPQDSFPFPHLGDVPEAKVEPRSLGDTRVRQFDELDRPRFNRRETHRGSVVNDERFTVVAISGPEDAQLARAEFSRAWNEFGQLANTFTNAHRNADFGIGQMIVVIDNEPLRERDTPKRTLQIQDGQTILYLNVAPGQPPLREQLPELREGAVHAMLHLAELDRKFPLWAQQGLAQYTAEKIAQQDSDDLARDNAADEEGFDQVSYTEDELVDTPLAADRFDDEEVGGMAGAKGDDAGNTRGAPVDVEYWRLQRAEPDRLAESVPDEENEAAVALERVRFLLEGDDAAHAPQFLLGLRALAEEATDPLLASWTELKDTQLLPPAVDTVVDVLFDELEPAFIAWQADPLRGQPLFIPSGEIPDPAMLGREKEMELVLKLAQLQTQTTTATEIRPRVTEFDADGQRETSAGSAMTTAINVDQLYFQLVDDETPWATTDVDGTLLLWTDHDRLAEVLGVADHRFSTEYRDGRWVLATVWDENTQLEAWLEPNQDNPSRPLVKFAARQRDTQVRVVELDARAKTR